MNSASKQSSMSPAVACMRDYLILLLLDRPDRMFTNLDGVTSNVFNAGKIPDTPHAKTCYRAALQSLTVASIVTKTTDSKTRRIRRLKLNLDMLDKSQVRDLQARSEDVAHDVFDTFYGTAEHAAFQQLLADCRRALSAMQEKARSLTPKHRDGDNVAMRAKQVIMRAGLSDERTQVAMYYLKKLKLTKAIKSHSLYMYWWQVMPGSVAANDLKERIYKDDWEIFSTSPKPEEPAMGAFGPVKVRKR
jgi:hypothetical protein